MLYLISVNTYSISSKHNSRDDNLYHLYFQSYNLRDDNLYHLDFQSYNGVQHLSFQNGSSAGKLASINLGEESPFQVSLTQNIYFQFNSILVYFHIKIQDQIKSHKLMAFG